MAFITKIDYSDNRQIKQRSLTNTELSGATVMGTSYSALTNGPDLTTTGVTYSATSIVSIFSGTTGSTSFIFGDSDMVLASGSLVPITSSNSGTTQYGDAEFVGNYSTIIDCNEVFLTYSGVSFDLVINQITEPSPGVFSGNTLSTVIKYSADTSDYTGSTTWLKVLGRAEFESCIEANGVYSNAGIFSGGTNLSDIFLTVVGSNTYTTGSTLYGTTAYFDRNDVLSAYTLDLSSLVGGSDTYVTGATFSGSTLILERNDAVQIFASYTGNTSGDCLTDLYIQDLYGCVDITLHDSIIPDLDNIIDLGSSIKRFRDVNSISGHTSIWVATTRVETPSLELGLDTSGNTRTITADNSVIQNDVLSGGTF